MSPRPSRQSLYNGDTSTNQKETFYDNEHVQKLIGSLTISLLFLLSATPSFAQQNDVKVTGKITDGSGARWRESLS